MKYTLICIAFDGEYKKDFTGTMEECINQSANMGSKWYFYPFHFIINERDVIKETGGGLIDMKTKESYLSKLFLNRKLKTVIKVFQKTVNYKEAIGFDPNDYEWFMHQNNQNLLRDHS